MSIKTIYEEVFDGQLTCYDAETFTFPPGGLSFATIGGMLDIGSDSPFGGKVEEPSVIIGFKTSLVTVTQGSKVVYRTLTMEVAKVKSVPENAVTFLELEPVSGVK